MRVRHSLINSLARFTRSAKHVDVEIVAFELVEDVAELGHRVGVSDCVVAHAVLLFDALDPARDSSRSPVP